MSSSKLSCLRFPPSNPPQSGHADPPGDVFPGYGQTVDNERWSDDDGGRAYLRALPVLSGTGRGFEVDEAPAEPISLFVAWLRTAVEAGVPEPHAMTISTVDAHGMPRARVLILKAVDD